MTEPTTPVPRPGSILEAANIVAAASLAAQSQTTDATSASPPVASTSAGRNSRRNHRRRTVSRPLSTPERLPDGNWRLSTVTTTKPKKLTKTWIIRNWKAQPQEPSVMLCDNEFAFADHIWRWRLYPGGVSPQNKENLSLIGPTYHFNELGEKLLSDAIYEDLTRCYTL